MKKAFTILVLLCVLQHPAPAQKVYVTKWKSEATHIAFITEWKSEASVIAFVSQWKSEAKPDSGIWYFTEWKNEADIIVYYTQWKSEANILVYFTKWKAEAEWKNNKPSVDLSDKEYHCKMHPPTGKFLVPLLRCKPLAHSLPALSFRLHQGTHKWGQGA